MITEDYVSLEVARLLKDKGFDSTCNGYYNQERLLERASLCSVKNTLSSPFYLDCIPAPTLQMAMKWLIEVYNLFITFELDFSDSAYPMFDAVVYNLATCEKYPIINYDRYSYIKGTEAAIKYCLENLI